MQRTIVIYHSADYDGIFSREVAAKFLPNAEFIGWDYGNPVPEVPLDCVLYMIDISIDALMGHPNLIWIDHHKSAIEKFDKKIAGYRIDGVAACRLAWQWFTDEIFLSVMNDPAFLPTKDEFIRRQVSEPFALTMAGEYDIWDHRGDGDLEFQFGLDAVGNIPWELLLDGGVEGRNYTRYVIAAGENAMRCYAKRDAEVMKSRSFLVEWEGLKFLALNTAKCNSNTFNSKDVPETGHDALMAFYYNGTAFSFSLYHAAHRKDIDLSLIAVKHGGGGHKGACGFRLAELPF